MKKIISRRIGRGKYYIKISKYEYEVYNHGYYPPDQCVWWEATSLQTSCADFHATTKKDLLAMMQEELLNL